MSIPCRTVDEFFEQEFPKHLVDATSSQNNHFSVTIEVEKTKKGRLIKISSQITLASTIIVMIIYAVIWLLLK